MNHVSFTLQRVFAFAPFRGGVNKSKELGVKQNGIGSYAGRFPALTPFTGLFSFLVVSEQGVALP